MAFLVLFGARLTTATTVTTVTTATSPVFGGLSTGAAQGVYLPAASETQLRNVNRTVYGVAQGGTNSKGTFTLNSNGATTLSVSHVNCGVNSIINWMPVTAAAAAQMMTVFVLSSGVTKGSFTVTQASNTTTGAIFNYVIHS